MSPTELQTPDVCPNVELWKLHFIGKSGFTVVQSKCAVHTVFMPCRFIINIMPLIVLHIYHPAVSPVHQNNQLQENSMVM